MNTLTQSVIDAQANGSMSPLHPDTAAAIEAHDAKPLASIRAVRNDRAVRHHNIQMTKHMARIFRKDILGDIEAAQKEYDNAVADNVDPNIEQFKELEDELFLNSTFVQSEQHYHDLLFVRAFEAKGGVLPMWGRRTTDAAGRTKSQRRAKNKVAKASRKKNRG